MLGDLLHNSIHAAGYPLQKDMKRSDYIKELKQCGGYCALDETLYTCNCTDPVFLPLDYDAAIYTTNM